VTDVSGLNVGPIFMGQAEQEFACLWKTGTVSCSEAPVSNHQFMLRNIREERRSDTQNTLRCMTMWH
jgi:hypothetical protein